MIKQILRPVLWEDSMRCLLQQGFDQLYEVGAGPRVARAPAADRPQGGVSKRGRVKQ